jgi:rubrerythrin
METQNNDSAQQMCPQCNVPMVDGTCPQCGAKAETPAAAAETPQA